MERKYLSVVLLICLTACLLPGCVFISRDFRFTKELIISELGEAEVETEFQLQVGSGLLSLGKFAASVADVDRNTMEYLRDIRNVQVGVYKLYDIDRNKPLKIPDRIAKNLARKGYEPIIKTKEKNSATWIFTKMRGKRLESLYVISLEQHELVLVEVKGRLERILQKAIREKGLEKGKFVNI